MIVKYPCPCCGHLVHEEQWSYQMCPVCGWFDDNTQLRWVEMSGGCNSRSLVEAQRDWRKKLAEIYGRQILIHECENPPYNKYTIEPGWRPVDHQLDWIEQDDGLGHLTDWPDDQAKLYYWRDTFWRLTEEPMTEAE